MSGFDFLFSFQSLLLGLAVARVATGVADMWRGRKDMVVGISPILLGLLILFSAAHQWMSAWEARNDLTIGPWSILVAIGITLPYVFVSQAMVPREQDTWASLEDYYMAHSRVFVGVLLVAPVISLCSNFVRGNVFGWSYAHIAVAVVIRLGIPVLLIVWQQRLVHRLGLAALTVTRIVGLFT
jgi:hypothetical protein